MGAGTALTLRREVRWRRIAPPVILGAAGVVAFVRIAEVLLIPGYFAGAVGTDVRYYLEATQRWLGGGSWYMPEQLAGPYDLTAFGVLYPPTALPLFVPFTVLPLVLWWAIPIGIVARKVWTAHPSRMGWALIAACVAFPMSLTHLLNGNPVMWVAALVALGGWRTALVAAIKPSLAPFALLGVRRRAWWVVAGILAAVSLAILPMWLDYATALRDANGSLLYSLKDVPLVLVPLIATARRRGCPASS